MRMFSRPVFAPEGADTGVATPVATGGKDVVSDGTTSLSTIAQTLIVPKKSSDVTPAGQGQEAEEVKPRAKAKAPDDDDAAEDGHGASDAEPKPQKPAKEAAPDDDEDAGGDDLTGGQADDEDFDPFSPAGSTVSDTQGATDDDGTPDAERHTVKVDGQDVEVTLGELKRAFSGAKAVEQRLEQAAADRAKIDTDRTALNAQIAEFQAETQANREAFAQGLLALKAVIAAPKVKRPDPALRQTNPAAYAAAFADWQADQLEVQSRAAYVDEAIAKYNTDKVEALNATKQAEAAKLVQVMPVLADPAKGPLTMKRIAAAATKAGFTTAEVSAAADHRLFVLAAMAGEYLRMKDKQATAREMAAKQAARQQTAVSAKGATTATPAGRAQTLHANRVNQAKRTGAVDDVAASLIVSKPKARRA